MAKHGLVAMTRAFLSSKPTVFESESYGVRYGAEVEVRCNQINMSLYKMAFFLADVNI